MPTRVIATFDEEVQQNCGWAATLHFLNADGSDHDLTPYGSLTGQVRDKPGYTATPLAAMGIVVTNAVGGLAVAGLAAKDTKSFPASNETFGYTTAVFAEIDGILTADPLNPVCLARGTLRVAPGGNAQQSSGTAPTVPLATISLVVGAVSAAAARAMIGLGSVTNDAQTKAAVVPNTAPAAAQVLIGNADGTAYAPKSLSGMVTITEEGVATVRNATAEAAGAMSPRQATQLLPPVANDFDPTVTDYATLATGYTPIVDSVVVTVDGTKAWRKFGSGALQWVATHDDVYTTGAVGTVITVPNLNCDTRGPFAVTFEIDAAAVNPTIFYLQVNGVETGFVYDDGIFYREAASPVMAFNSFYGKLTDPIISPANSTSGRTGRIASLTVSCDAPSSANSVRLFRVEGWVYRNANASSVNCILTGWYSWDGAGEITSVGIRGSLLLGMAATSKATLRR